MTRSQVYTVKSNARRACRRLGYSPNRIVETDNGWWFPIDDQDKAKPSAAPKETKPEKAKGYEHLIGRSRKRARLKLQEKTNATATKAATAIKPAKPAKAPRPPGAIGGNRKIILDAITDKRGATMPELLKATGMKPHTIRARISELVEAEGLTVSRERFMRITTYKAIRNAKAA